MLPAGVLVLQRAHLMLWPPTTRDLPARLRAGYNSISCRCAAAKVRSALAVVTPNRAGGVAKSPVPVVVHTRVAGIRVDALVKLGEDVGVR